MKIRNETKQCRFSERIRPDKNILIISAHADDHICCAGTVLKLQNMGFSAFEVVLTDSAEGRDKRNPKTKAVKSLRKKELSKASKLLGVKKTFLLDEEDLGLTYSKGLVFKLVKIIREIQPEVGFIMNKFDWHPDHRETFKIASEAFKWAASGVQPELGEFFKTPKVLCSEGMLPIKADVLVDVTKYKDLKMQIFKSYDSQADSKSLRFVEGLMNVRGYQARDGKTKFAEAFNIDQLNPLILFDDEKK